MTVLALDHIQIAMPAGQEDAARAFYTGVLGLREQEKPAHLAPRGGCWFESGSIKIHLGVDPGFSPATKAHPAFLVQDVATMTEKARASGFRVVADEPLEGYERSYVYDPFGNRIELMQRVPR
jgi:catechol 2,3-dioxygenase-like lactoylglutathione lyase family enzyme